jgi:adenosine deaminase CECR1
MMFNKAKERMSSTKLWEIVKQMPKGSVLHAHHAATVPVEWILEKVLASQDMYFIAEAPLDSEAKRKDTILKFVYLKKGPRWMKSSKAMWHPEYEAGSPVPVQEAARSFPNGGEYGFGSWIRNRCTVTDEESLDPHMG